MFDDELIAEEWRAVGDYTGQHAPDCTDAQAMPLPRRRCAGLCVIGFDTCPAPAPF